MAGWLAIAAANATAAITGFITSYWILVPVGAISLFLLLYSVGTFASLDDETEAARAAYWWGEDLDDADLDDDDAPEQALENRLRREKR
jgi:hypothetical protein